MEHHRRSAQLYYIPCTHCIDRMANLPSWVTAHRCGGNGALSYENLLAPWPFTQGRICFCGEERLTVPALIPELASVLRRLRLQVDKRHVLSATPPAACCLFALGGSRDGGCGSNRNSCPETSARSGQVQARHVSHNMGKASAWQCSGIVTTRLLTKRGLREVTISVSYVVRLRHSSNAEQHYLAVVYFSYTSMLRASRSVIGPNRRKNAARSMARHLESVTAVMVAARGSSLMSARSPKYAPA